MSSDRSARQNKSETREQFAMDWTGPGLTELELRIRELVDSLKQGVLDAISKASAAEIAGFLKTADLASARQLFLAGSRAVPTRENAAERAANGTAVRRRDGWRDRVDDNERDTKGSHNVLQNPFDITSPGELLASTQEKRSVGQPFGHSLRGASFGFDSAPASTSDLSSSFHESAPAADAPSASPERPNPPAAAESTVVLPVGDQEAESERRPRIVLREGERLLSATGSGVVIRRERRVAPTR